MAFACILRKAYSVVFFAKKLGGSPSIYQFYIVLYYTILHTQAMKSWQTVLCIFALVVLHGSCAPKKIVYSKGLAQQGQLYRLNYFLPKKVATVEITYTYVDEYVFELIRTEDKKSLQTQKLLEINPLGYFIDTPIKITFELLPDETQAYNLEYKELALGLQKFNFTVNMDSKTGGFIQSINAEATPITDQVIEAAGSLLGETLQLAQTAARNAANEPNRELIFEYEERKIKVVTTIDLPQTDTTYVIPRPDLKRGTLFPEPKVSLRLGPNPFEKIENFDSEPLSIQSGLIYRMPLPIKTELLLEQNVQRESREFVMFSDFISYPQFGHAFTLPLVFRGRRNVSITFSPESGSLERFRYIKDRDIVRILNAASSSADDLRDAAQALQNNQLQGEVERLILENQKLEELLRKIELERQLNLE